MEDGTVGAQMGATTTDSHGNGVFHAVVPLDAPHGDATLSIIAGLDCWTETYMVVGTPVDPISIDDDTVVPGQQVTIVARDFFAETTVTAYLDGDARDALCQCRPLAKAQADAAGSVEMVVQIPRDISPGDHVIVLNGDDPDGLSEMGLAVHITVDR